MIPSSVDELENDLDSVEQISPHVRLEWLFGKRGFAITVSDGSREMIDTWFDAVCDIAMAWPTNQLLLSLYDFSYPYIAMSPYARSRSEALRDLRPELHTRTAVVLHNGFVARLVQLFVMLDRRESLVVRIFSSRQPAMAWLRQELAERDR